MRITRENILRWLKTYADVVRANRDYLTELDAAIGDADHGANMDRGFQAVVARLPGVAGQDIGTILKTVGMALVSTVGGAAGPLYGTFFLQAAAAAAGKTELTPEDWLAALEAGVNGVVSRGKSGPGDKTMLDALLPAVEAFRAALQQSLSLDEALRRSAEAAEKGAVATIPLVARRGRASYLGERSAGHQDPGATSSYLLLKAASESLVDAAGNS